MGSLSPAPVFPFPAMITTLGLARASSRGPGVWRRAVIRGGAFWMAGRRWHVSIRQHVPVPLGCEVTLSPQSQAQLSPV